MDRSAIRAQIDRILHSQSLANKSQLRKLLEILHKNIDSQTTLATEVVIHELWPTETRTKHAKDVATEMNRLRRAVESYYNVEGKNDDVIIYFPKRTPSGNGNQETRWMVAMLRNGTAAFAPDPPHLASAKPPQLPVAAHGQSRPGWKRAGVIIALCVLGVMGYVSIRLRAMPEQPNSARLEGSALVVMNGEGKELWRKTFPDGIGPDWYYSVYLHTPVWFADLDGRGHTSVLFIYSPATHPSEPHSSTLICYSDSGKEKWRWTPGRELPELRGTPATFKTYALRVLKAMGKRPPRIVVSSAHDPWWPNQIALLDSDGKLVSEYWHSGALPYLTLGDLDGDGKQEIIATGMSEYDHQATLVVLDPDRLFGASTEEQPEFQIHGMGRAQERLRLLFPRSDLNRALFQYNEATDPSVDHRVTRLTVLECIKPRGCPIWYEFDKDLRLMAAYAGGDDFRSAHERFYQTGQHNHTLSAEEQAAFQKVRCLVGCKSEFVPVGNLVP
jgi:hypothetical protein